MRLKHQRCRVYAQQTFQNQPVKTTKSCYEASKNGSVSTVMSSTIQPVFPGCCWPRWSKGRAGTCYDFIPPVIPAWQRFKLKICGAASGSCGRRRNIGGARRPGECSWRPKPPPDGRNAASCHQTLTPASPPHRATKASRERRDRYAVFASPR